MEIIAFDKLVLRTAFCCMASNGVIEKSELSLLNEMCSNSNLFVEFNFHEEINVLVSEINNGGKKFISHYFEMLKSSKLNEEEELTLIDFAIKTINADQEVDYSEIKFFKVIRHNLKVTDEKILEIFPDIEMFLESDIQTESYLEKITRQFLDSAEIPIFDLITPN
jgi:uncharacterized tellurite resistance protein B-like protein